MRRTTKKHDDTQFRRWAWELLAAICPHEGIKEGVVRRWQGCVHFGASSFHTTYLIFLFCVVYIHPSACCSGTSYFSVHGFFSFGVPFEYSLFAAIYQSKIDLLLLFAGPKILSLMALINEISPR